ncbi:MAG: DUF4262 domain-containing protein [Clostridium sp.]|nr:DUF4262 domain-containing protein [Clostridium sp.]MBQ8999690.1 DUF4262 domain-containing protein [Clostridium sp.]
MESNLNAIKEDCELMKKNGYIIHNVFPTRENEIFSHHTHGLKENYNHMDLQIALGVHPAIINPVLDGVANQIKNGVTFEDKLVSDRVIQGFDVQLVKVKFGSRELLRIILPDENGKFPSDKDCADGYKNQLDDILKNSSTKNH